MARKKRGLQKSVDSIFEGVALQDVIRQGLPRDLNPQEKAPQEEQVPTTNASTSVQDRDPDLPEAPADAPIAHQTQAALDSVDSLDAPESSDDVSQDDRIKQLMAAVSCAKDFNCVHSQLDNLCQARLGRKGKIVQCLEDKKPACSFRLSFILKKICRCPVRQHIARHWGK